MGFKKAYSNFQPINPEKYPFDSIFLSSCAITCFFSFLLSSFTMDASLQALPPYVAVTKGHFSAVTATHVAVYPDCIGLPYTE